MPYNPVMPLYEFTCASCGERFEFISSDADRDENAVCPSCGGRDVSRVFSGFTVGISRTRLNPGRLRTQEGQADGVQAARRRLTHGCLGVAADLLPSHGATPR